MVEIQSHNSEVHRTTEQALNVDSVRSESMVESPESMGKIDQRHTSERIERSKCHWSEISTAAKLGSKEDDGGDSLGLGSIDEEELEKVARVSADNRELFKTLESDPIVGSFFWASDDFGQLEMKEKFAKGGQAELFYVCVKWKKREYNERDEEHGIQYVLKVFKKGILLRHLQSQWPQGLLQFQVQEYENWQSSTPKNHPRFHCNVKCGTLLEDGRFAFLLIGN